MTTDLGFEPRTLIQARVNFPSSAYQTAPERDAYFRRAVEQIGALPGVVAAGEAAGGPMGGIDTDLQRPGEVATGSPKGLVILCDVN